MSVVINLNEVITDDWAEIEDSDEMGSKKSVIISLLRLQRDWEDLRSSDYRIGVELEVTDEVEEIGEFLPRLDLVVLNFNVFADGRAFSQARLLRERFGYQGDLRARGDVIRDQLSFMHRCGFTQFHLAESEEVELALNAFSDISDTYQPEIKSATIA
jgi:uncharacterized protein (DUF934 family)